MGMNTQLYMVAELKQDLPENVLRILKCLNKDEGNDPWHWEHCKDGEWLGGVEVGGWENEVRQSESHPLFKTERWQLLETNVSDDMLVSGDDLKVRGYFKNYDNEISKFVDWITPYLEHWTHDIIGVTEYDDDDWHRALRI
jgi:hypothetical protein